MSEGELKGQLRPSLPLEGEDIATTRWEDARHWMSIYADLLEFKRGLLERVRKDIVKLQPLAQKAAAIDLTIIETQMRGYEARLDLWYRRIWALQGLWIDPEGRVVRHQGREVALTKREFQLLQFLLELAPLRRRHALVVLAVDEEDRRGQPVSELGADVGAVTVGQHEIQDHEIGMHSEDLIENERSVRHVIDGDRETLFERRLDRRRRVRIVLG